MSILEGVLNEELERIQKNISSYQSLLAVIPSGYVCKQTISGRVYFYRKQRVGKTVRSEYLGPGGSEAAKRAISDYLERKRLLENLRTLRKEEEKLLKALRHYGH